MKRTALLLLLLPALACADPGDAAAPTDAERMHSGLMNPGSALPCVEFASGADTNAAFRLLVFGNSIALHGPKPDIGWTADWWGMAATAPEKDFPHRLAAGLAERLGRPVVCRVRNLAAMERSFRTAPADRPEFAGDVAWEPDAVVIAIGENAPNLNDASAPGYTQFLQRLAEPFRDGARAPRIVFRTPFWKNERKAACTEEAAAATGAACVDAGPLGDAPENTAAGVFAHPGVARHPGDLGMQRLAEQLLDVLAPASPQPPQTEP
ncbi:MAG: SGNH/GDSL hydrolase family protein [Kiritimatiellae bacterium]|nr:SGNH/GDSL hydrolase family protein [Kiritimatiellia bacterium]